MVPGPAPTRSQRGPPRGASGQRDRSGPNGPRAAGRCAGAGVGVHRAGPDGRGSLAMARQERGAGGPRGRLQDRERHATGQRIAGDAGSGPQARASRRPGANDARRQPEVGGELARGPVQLDGRPADRARSARRRASAAVGRPPPRAPPGAARRASRRIRRGRGPGTTAPTARSRPAVDAPIAPSFSANTPRYDPVAARREPVGAGQPRDEATEPATACPGSRSRSTTGSSRRRTWPAARPPPAVRRGARGSG